MSIIIYLGETYQGRFLENETEVFCEQTTHHPPASNFQVVPKDGESLFIHGDIRIVSNLYRS